MRMTIGPCAIWLLAALFNRGEGQDSKVKKEVIPGWPGVFTNMGNYQATFKKPEISEDKKSYRQTATYTWLGGRLESNEVTLARGQAFTKDYVGAALLKDANAPELVKFGNFTGWHWKEKKLAAVILDKDRVLVVQIQFDGDPVGFAAKFPLKDCLKALDNPPRLELARNVQAFSQLKKGMSYTAIVDQVGKADKDIGSGIHIMVYRLEDGTQIYLGFPDFKELIYAKHIDKEGKATDLLK